jgi:hypothetical protein
MPRDYTRRVFMRTARLALLVASTLAAGCERVERPNRPVPESFEAKALDGTKWTRETLSGQPWVINLWVPG